MYSTRSSERKHGMVTRSRGRVPGGTQSSVILNRSAIAASGSRLPQTEASILDSIVSYVSSGEHRAQHSRITIHPLELSKPLPFLPRPSQDLACIGLDACKAVGAVNAESFLFIPWWRIMLLPTEGPNAIYFWFSWLLLL